MSVAPLSFHPPAARPHASSPAASSGLAAAKDATDSVANTGSASTDNIGSFFRSLSDSLQATMSQQNSGSTPTAANRPLSGMPHHHLHRNEGDTGPVGQPPSQSVAQALKAYASSAA